MINVFVLGYNGANYFEEWHSKVNFSNDIKFHFIDNGNQNLSNYFSNLLIHKTQTNIFCAGGWNIICDIGFDYMKLDKIIIAQEDGKFDEEVLKKIYENTNGNNICGAYNNNWEFSLFGIHSETFNLVGRFDENFLLVGDEDNDYKHRCKINNITISSIGVPSTNNISITGEIRLPVIKRNGEYLHSKWGKTNNSKNRIYEYDLPYNGEQPLVITNDYRKHFDLSDNVETYMSEVEYNRFKQLRNGNG